MEFLRLLLVFVHLLGMAMLVGMVMLQLTAGKQAPLNKGWLHGVGLQLISGLGLMGMEPALDDVDYDHAKLGIKILVLLAIGVLAAVFVRRPVAPPWLTPTLGGLIVLNVGLAVFWT